MKNQQQAWNNSQDDTQRVQVNRNLGGQISAVFLSHADLHGQRTGDGAWQISRSNQLAVLESQGLVIFGGVGAVSKSSGSWCCPSRDASKASADLQGEAGIDVFDGAESDSGNSEWVSDAKLLAYNLNAWDNVAQPDQSQSEAKPEQGFNQIAKAKEKWLTSSQCCKQQRSYGYDVAGKRTLTHSQFDSSKGPAR